MDRQHTILTITGSDSTGQSGIQADISVIQQLGCHAVSAITSITAQNRLGIQEFYDIPASVVKGQIEAIINDVQPEVVKIGLIRSIPVLEVITDALLKYHPRYVIYDPIFFSSKGERLISDDVVRQLSERLVPLCSLVISKRLRLHGQNNAYSSAVCAFLAKGDSLEDAQQRALEYVDAHHHRGDETYSPRAHSLFREFMALLDKHYKEGQGVAFYADCMNITPRYLAQVCRLKKSKSAKQIIDEYLCEKLEDALLHTTKSIQQIAQEMGFSSQAHLSNFFKHIKGISPSLYRKSKQK